MSRRALVLVLAGALALVAVAVAFRGLFEPVEHEVETGFRGEARRNPLLAAERLYAALGVPATSVRGPLGLPAPDHALVLCAPRAISSGFRATRILDWVSSGGHLIVTPRPGEEAVVSDPLLAPFGIWLDHEGEAGSEVLSVSARSGVPGLEVSMAQVPRLADSGSYALLHRSGPDEGAVLLRYAHGAGEVTVLNDCGFLVNERLGEHDHARFAWSLLAGDPLPAGVWLVYRDVPPSLAGLLVRRAWPALVSALILLAIWLWRAASRFGPLLPAPPRARRSLLEHVEASGAFLWRHGQCDSLLESSRWALMSRIERQHPEWLRQPRSELVRRLAELTGLRAGQIATAIGSQSTRDPAAFTQSVRSIERVRRSL